MGASLDPPTNWTGPVPGFVTSVFAQHKQFGGPIWVDQTDASDPTFGLLCRADLMVWRPPRASRVSRRTQTSTTRCAAAGRRAQVLGSRGGVGRAATGTPSGQPPRARLQPLPHARP